MRPVSRMTAAQTRAEITWSAQSALPVRKRGIRVSRGDVYVAQRGVLAHRHHVELVAEVAVVGPEDDVDDEGDAGDDEDGRGESAAVREGDHAAEADARRRSGRRGGF
jgi:hypothetical protein